MNSSTPIKKTWEIVRKIKGKKTDNTVKHLTVDGNTITDKKDIANNLAMAFAHNSSTGNYTEKFQRHKRISEKKPIKYKSTNRESYNQPFSMEELQDSLHKSHDTAPGPDNIHYQILKHLPFDTLKILLGIFNIIWIEETFPKIWSEAIIIPIPKPNKDNTDPKNYRPIALTSCICKTMERMINDRLTWFLETNSIITEFQSGFRKQRSSTDQLIRFETFIRETFVLKQHAVAVLFDLEKAYDTTWKHGILKDMYDMGLRGRMPMFIQHFLEDRCFKVRVGTTLSDSYKQEMGVPQGSILSVTLFSIKINSIVKCLSPGIACSLYVDDFLISYRGQHMYSIERQMQQCLNKLQTWSDQNGFKFSKSKTVCMHFCQKRKLHADPELRMDGVLLPVVREAKFLGVIFDRKLNFVSHLKYIKNKSIKAMNLLKMISHSDWGADRYTLMRLYKSHIRSKLDYGSIVYGAARKSYIKTLDTVQNQALRLCLGAFRTSPMESLYVEAGEYSLYYRRHKLSMQYAIKLYSNPKNPAYNTVFKPNFITLFEKQPTAIAPFGIRIKPFMENCEIELKDIAKYLIPKTPPWLMKTPKTLLELTEFKKNDTIPDVYKAKYHEIRQQYSHHMPIYTDGSKDGASVAAAAITKYHTFQSRLPNHTSIFTAELKAILLAFKYIQQTRNTKFIIFCDSLSSLIAICNLKIDNPIILKVLDMYNQLAESNEILICWVPSHIGILGNEKADQAAKAALTHEIEHFYIPYSDYQQVIQTYLIRKWQEDWDKLSNNKLYKHHPDLQEPHRSNYKKRREEVVMARLRLGHSHLTHCYLLKNEDQPECVPCQESLTVEHILLHCTDFYSSRIKYYSAVNMRDLFQNVSAENIFQYLQEIGLYFKM